MERPLPPFAIDGTINGDVTGAGGSISARKLLIHICIKIEGWGNAASTIVDIVPLAAHRAVRLLPPMRPIVLAAAAAAATTATATATTTTENDDAGDGGGVIFEV